MSNMLSFIPMNDVASIYTVDLNNLDDWGHGTSTLSYKGRCRILYNTDLLNISLADGKDVRPSITIIFHGFVKCKPLDRMEFIDELGETHNYPIEDRYYMRDWTNNIVATRVVYANGKRDL